MHVLPRVVTASSLVTIALSGEAVGGFSLRVTELATPPGSVGFDIAYDVNNAGTVIGERVRELQMGGRSNPVLWQNGVPALVAMPSIDTHPAFNPIPRPELIGIGSASINEGGSAVFRGQYSRPTSTDTTFRLSGTTASLLPALGAGSDPGTIGRISPAGIGPTGRVVGAARLLSCPGRQGGGTALGGIAGFFQGYRHPGSCETVFSARWVAAVTAIGEGGELAVQLVRPRPSGENYRAAIVTPGGDLIELPFPPGLGDPGAGDSLSRVVAINGLGQAVGWIQTRGGYQTGILWAPTSPGSLVYNAVQMGGPDALSASPVAISDEGLVLGGSGTRVWMTPSSESARLLDLLPPESPYTGIVGLGMSPNGVIAGQAQRDGVAIAVVMEVVPCDEQPREEACDADTDGDGIPDEWEREGGGIDVDGNGTPDIVLYNPPYNARPNRKDIFVEVDSGPNSTLSPQAKSAVEQAFRDAPVHVSLHILVDQTDLPMLFSAPIGADTFPTNIDTYYENHFGLTVVRGPGGPPLNLVRDALKKFVRHCVIYETFDDGANGKGEIYGDQFCVAFGAPVFTQNNPEVWSAAPKHIHQAATFMHELGHTLGLGHNGLGGDRDEDGNPVLTSAKPNHPSIMNYAMAHPYQFSWSPKHGSRFWRLDYSREELPGPGISLDERHLNELAGLAGRRAQTRRMQMPFGYGPPGLRQMGLAKLDGSAIDWEGDGEPFGDDVEQDVNYLANDFPHPALRGPSPAQQLRGANEWAALKVAFATDGNFVMGVHNANLAPTDGPSAALAEPTMEMITFINQRVPAPCDPIVLADPTSRVISQGLHVAFRVLAASDNGEPVAYRWRLGGQPLTDGGPYAGSDTPLLSILVSGEELAGTYDCVMSNSCGSVASVEATLTVLNRCPGDADSDRDADMMDLNIVLSDFGREPAQPGVYAGDLDTDGDCDFVDLNILLSRFGTSCPPPPS